MSEVALLAGWPGQATLRGEAWSWWGVSHASQRSWRQTHAWCVPGADNGAMYCSRVGWGRVAIEEVREIKGPRIMWALTGHGRYFAFYSELSGEPGGCVQRNNVLWISLWKIHFGRLGCRNKKADCEAVMISPPRDDGDQEVVRGWILNRLRIHFKMALHVACGRWEKDRSQRWLQGWPEWLEESSCYPMS